MKRKIESILTQLVNDSKKFTWSTGFRRKFFGARDKLMKLLETTSETPSSLPTEGMPPIGARKRVSMQGDPTAQPASMGGSGSKGVRPPEGGKETPSPEADSFYTVGFENFNFRCGDCIHCEKGMCDLQKFYVDMVYGHCSLYLSYEQTKEEIYTCSTTP